MLSLESGSITRFNTAAPLTCPPFNGSTPGKRFCQRHNQRRAFNATRKERTGYPQATRVEVEVGRGKTVAEAVKKIGVTEQTYYYYRWKKQYGGGSTPTRFSRRVPWATSASKRGWSIGGQNPNLRTGVIHGARSVTSATTYGYVAAIAPAPATPDSAASAKKHR